MRKVSSSHERLPDAEFDFRDAKSAVRNARIRMALSVDAQIAHACSDLIFDQTYCYILCTQTAAPSSELLSSVSSHDPS